MKLRNTEEFIFRSKILHGNKYDYSLVEYIESKKHVKIICPKHGVFVQTPNLHLQGGGCFFCKDGTLREHFKLTIEEFSLKANIVHNGKYDYSKVVYVNNKTKVEIICPKHGSFLQVPNRHLRGDGCPVCHESHGEREISKILELFNVPFIRQKTFPSCKIKYKLRFDFYLIDFNILIEYHGEQHYFPSERFGGFSTFIDRKLKDEYKEKWAEQNNITLKIYKYNDTISFIEKDICKIIKQ